MAAEITATARGAGSDHRVVDPGDPPRRLRALSWWAGGTLILVAVVNLLLALIEGGYLAILSEYLDGRATADEVEDAQLGVLGWLVIYSAVSLLAVVLFVAWFYRAYRNLSRLGVAELRWRPGWAIGSWFVPILNFFRPKQIANDLWRASGRGVDVSGGAWRSRPVAPLLHWWWGLFLTSGVAGAILGAIFPHQEFLALTEAQIEDERSAAIATILVSLLSGTAASVAVLAVRRLSERQDALLASVSEARKMGAVPAAAAPHSPAPEGGRAWRCEACGWRFSSRDSALDHARVHHAASDPAALVVPAD